MAYILFLLCNALKINLKRLILFLIICMFVVIWFNCMYAVWGMYKLSTGAQYPGRPEEGMDSLELELRAVVSCLLWLLGTKLRSSTR